MDAIEVYEKKFHDVIHTKRATSPTEARLWEVSGKMIQ